MQSHTGITHASDAERSRLRGKTVERIVNEWQQHIHRHNTAFAEAAKQMEDFDTKLAKLFNKVKECQNHIIRLEFSFKSLENNLSSMEATQNQVDTYLNDLEKEVETEIRRRHETWTTADVQREKNYKLAEKVDSEVISMMQRIDSITNKLNSFDESNPDDQADDFSRMVQVVDLQQRAMNDLKMKVQKLEQMRQQAESLLDDKHRQLEKKSTQRNQRAGNHFG
jgi:chromosome segregation ATPase